MPNYHGYKCRKCDKELEGLRNENNRTEGRLDETVEIWDAVYWCPDEHGELWITVEEHVLHGEFMGDETIESYQEIVASHWKPKY